MKFLKKILKNPTTQVFFSQLSHWKYTILLCTLVCYIIFLSEFQIGIGSNIWPTIVLLAAINASHKPHGRTIYYYGALIILNIWLSEVSVYLTATHVLLLIIFLWWTTLRFLATVLKDKKVDADYLAWAIDGYLLLWIIGGYVAYLVEYINPASFLMSSALPWWVFHGNMAFMYRSFSTLTTLGYGDISPISPSATSLAILLVVFGQIYLTILLGIMLAKFLQRKK